MSQAVTSEETNRTQAREMNPEDTLRQEDSRGQPGGQEIRSRREGLHRVANSLILWSLRMWVLLTCVLGMALFLSSSILLMFFLLKTEHSLLGSALQDLKSLSICDDNMYFGKGSNFLSNLQANTQHSTSCILIGKCQKELL